MNRGVLQSSPAQQMMAAGNSNWWNINGIRPPVVQQNSPFLAPPPNLFTPFAPPPPPSSSWHDNNHEFPESLSQLLLGGLVGEEDKSSTMMFMQAKKLENWEEQLLTQTTNGAHVYGQQQGNVEFQGEAKPNWTQMIPLSSSSPKSCITTTLSSNKMLDFSNNKKDGRHPPPDLSSESNGNGNGGAAKKARVKTSATQSTFKVRKEKLGDRITALHQLVSPFGKTDTASVLFEAIGYIGFLQRQLEALSLPYIGSGSGNTSQQQQQSLSVQAGERNNSLFPDQEAGQLDDNCLRRKGRTSEHKQDSHELEPKKDLRSRGLCLVPISCTLQVGSDNGADYWASALGGGFR